MVVVGAVVLGNLRLSRFEVRGRRLMPEGVRIPGLAQVFEWLVEPAALGGAGTGAAEHHGLAEQRPVRLA